jgi:hypothetical protein
VQVITAALAACGLAMAAGMTPALAGPAQGGARLWAALFPDQAGRTGSATALAVSPTGSDV